MFDSLRPHGLQPTRLLHPWDFPGKSTGVGCHCLLPLWKLLNYKFKKKIISSLWSVAGFFFFSLSLCWTVACQGLLSMAFHFPGKNSGVGSHFVLQRIFWTQGQTRISCVSCIGRHSFPPGHLGSPSSWIFYT